MKVILLLFFAFFYTGCSYFSFLEKKIDKSRSAIILIKTNNLKFNDAGFINQKQNDLEIKVFSTGVEVLDLDINSHICLNSICYQKEVFNRDYLSLYYPQDILKNIFTKKEIFDGKNKVLNNDGFSQIIITDKVNIIYKVANNSIYFKDTKNKIIIKVTFV